MVKSRHMEYEVLVSKQAQKDFKRIKDAGLAPKVRRLIDILHEDPFKEYPRYEALRGDLKGFYSRRINIQHRLVYSVDKKTRTVRILRMWTHYDYRHN